MFQTSTLLVAHCFEKKSEIKYESWRTFPTTEKQVLYWSYSPAPSVGWWFLAKTLLSLRFGSVSRPGRKGGLFFIGFGRVPDASSPSFSSRTHGHYTHKTAANEKRRDEKKKKKNSSQPVINPFPLPFFPGSGLEETNKIKKRKKTTITTLLPQAQNTQSDDPHRLDPLASFIFFPLRHVDITRMSLSLMAILLRWHK